MKSWILVLPLLCLTPFALADDPAQPAASEAAPQTQKTMAAQEKARLKQRDMRHCLEKKSNREIHRCTVKRSKN
jgi:uncharacterized membrane protein YgcG